MLNIVTLYFTKPRAGDHTEGRRDFWKEMGPTYLRRLYLGCARHLKQPHTFHTITDSPEAVFGALKDYANVGGAPYLHQVGDAEDVPGWWMKLKLFDPSVGLKGKTLYLDLDNVIAGDLTPLLALADPDEIVMADDVVHPRLPNGGMLLCYPERWRELWTDYAAAPQRTRARFATWPHASDQAYIAAAVRERRGFEPLLAQEHLPAGFILNARAELEQGAEWAQTRLVIGSWDPKPHASAHPFYAMHWID